MYLKNGLQVVVKVNVWMRHNKDKLELTGKGRLKFLDNEDDRNKGNTCMVHEALCLGKVEEATTIGRGSAKVGRRIWWFGWSPWLWWREWSWWHWKKRYKETMSWFKVNLHDKQLGQEERKRKIFRQGLNILTRTMEFSTILGTCWRMCRFGGGGCRDVFDTLCETTLKRE